MITSEQQKNWDEAGFFIEKSVFPPNLMTALDDAVIERIRKDPPQNHAGPDGLPHGYPTGTGLAVLERKGMPDAVNPEDHLSKLFNTHRDPGVAQDIMRNRHILERVGALLGIDAERCAVIQSQYIFKNPGAWGQPWHQDSFYFDFDKQPQIGVWIATSPARIENGCLYVAPGSHTEPVHDHLKPDRADSNQGYYEIKDYDFSGETPVLLDPGDVLYFHSYLMHKSIDNTSSGRRTAYVLHYAQAGTKNLNPKVTAVVDIQPVTPL